MSESVNRVFKEYPIMYVNNLYFRDQIVLSFLDFGYGLVIQTWGSGRM